jgi:hypothetical protein
MSRLMTDVYPTETQDHTTYALEPYGSPKKGRIPCIVTRLLIGRLK